MDIDGKTAAAGGGILATIIGWCANKVYGNLSHRITSASHAAASASAAVEKSEERRRQDVIAIHKRIEEHAEEDRRTFAAVNAAINENTSMLGHIHADLQKALGDRPTRDEVNRLIELHQGAKS